MVHELRALHSVCWVGGLVRIVSEGCACGSRGGHLCVVDIKNISGRYEGVDKGRVVDVEEIQGVWSKEAESLFGVLCG